MKQATHFSVQPGWKLILLDMGLNPAHILTLAGLPADLFSRENATLTAEEYFNLWRGLEQVAGTEALPLKIGQAISVEAFDPPIFASFCSPNLNTALQRLAEFKRLIGPMIMTVDIGREQTRVKMTCYGHNGRIPESLGATELVFVTQLARIATRKKIVPENLKLPQLPRDTAPYEAYFGRVIRPGKDVGIAFSARDAARPFLTENTGMWHFFEPALRKRLSDIDAGTRMSQKVKSALLEMLPGGQSTIEAAAKRLAVSKRTLQRHLNQESASYQEILNNTRKELAEHYLSRSVIPPAEISFLLGYQDSNSFIRAFRSWTGTTPGEYRSGKLNFSSAR